MTRHGRNCTAGTVYTYHERKKDTKQSGFGSQSLRFGKDAVKVGIHGLFKLSVRFCGKKKYHFTVSIKLGPLIAANCT